MEIFILEGTVIGNPSQTGQRKATDESTWRSLGVQVFFCASSYLVQKLSCWSCDLFPLVDGNMNFGRWGWGSAGRHASMSGFDSDTLSLYLDPLWHGVLLYPFVWCGRHYSPGSSKETQMGGHLLFLWSRADIRVKCSEHTVFCTVTGLEICHSSETPETCVIEFGRSMFIAC